VGKIFNKNKLILPVCGPFKYPPLEALVTGKREIEKEESIILTLYSVVFDLCKFTRKFERYYAITRI
jgi:hypothetical protein